VCGFCESFLGRLGSGGTGFRAGPAITADNKKCCFGQRWADKEKEKKGHGCLLFGLLLVTSGNGCHKPFQLTATGEAYMYLCQHRQYMQSHATLSVTL
jgi:hypothetical protein